MTLFTPGPWRLHVRQTAARKRIQIWQNKGGQPNRGEYLIADHVMFPADAIAIAALPDMIDALRQWQAAERDGDQVELENARQSRDLALLLAGVLS